MTLKAVALAGIASLGLLGCGVPGSNLPDATPEQVARAAYSHDGPPALTLYTMINNRSGAGAHTSLMINASQRVVFDPAGSVRTSHMPERGDVLYGITPQLKQLYESAHARETFHVRIQRIEVSPELAEQALQLAMTNGKVPGGACTSATSALLRKLPGFETLPQALFPNKLADGFATLPGVTETKLFENDADDKTLAIEAFETQIPQP